MISYYDKFHLSIEHSLSKYYQSLNLDISCDTFHFPKASFIICNDISDNFVLTQKGGSISQGTYQLYFGSHVIIRCLNVIASDDCKYEVKIPNNDESIFGEGSQSFSFDFNEVIATINFIIIQGIVNIIDFSGMVPAIKNVETTYKAKIPISIASFCLKKSIYLNESAIFGKLEKKKLVQGVIVNGAGIISLILLFYDPPDCKIPRDYDYFYLPSGPKEYKIQFPSPKTASSVKLIIYEKTSMFSGARFSFY
jgi:hypothetical protein